MSICYDSRMHVSEMYSRSADSISNLYLRKLVRGVVNCAPDGAGFAQTLGSICFISRGMKSALYVHEYSGKLAYCFDEFAVELRKLVTAKLEIVKAVSVAIVISVGICMPLMIILPRVIDFISSDILLLGVVAVNSYIWFGSIKLAVSRYLKKSSEINTWWQGN